MQDLQGISVEELMKNPEIGKVIGCDSQEMIERRSHVPLVCEVFHQPYTRLISEDIYQFHIDREARKCLPAIIDNVVQKVVGEDTPDQALKAAYGKQRNIGIVFSGGPAPGGHNVIAGIYDAAKKANPENRVYGFLLGPEGIVENDVTEIDDELVNQYRNLGGFTMIKTGRTKIDTPRKMVFSRETCQTLNLSALVVIGGDDSNTNAAFLAQEMFKDNIQVIGVPKTIDGDIQVKDAQGHVLCAMSFGFHTAARAFANSVGNLCTDSSSDVKYWHICKVMGRVASHLALEVALQTHANITLIGEELADYTDNQRIQAADKSEEIDYHAYGMTLRHLSRVICDGIVRRAAFGKNYGVIVIPEGILEFINEIQVFIIKLSTIIAEYNQTHDSDFHAAYPVLEDKLEFLRRLARRSEEENGVAVWNRRDDDLFNDIPEFFQEGLLMERDSHGNFQFSQVETDKVVMGLVKDYLDILKEEGEYKVGIEQVIYRKNMAKSGLDPDLYGKAIFRNYPDDMFLMVKKSIISIKTLKQALLQAGLIQDSDDIPAPVEKIYQKSVPKFKTQAHFYGYDGRGNDPTRFDCNYTYNLGLTVFSLIANGSTGQMAGIKNLEKDFAVWEPIGIPIAPLMHLEERKGKLALVIEKSVVDIHSTAFQAVKSSREKWLAAGPEEDDYRRSGPIRFAGKSEEDRPITLVLNAIKTAPENFTR
ncbi:MAG: 6-phosphofructokinase [Desulfobacterales bacterium]|nr:6-phosphofructokinase [Desulfobacterales bacterium]MDX2513415.1 6-phosphofructokinase [Desulfobacterales bacterium]